MTPNLCNSGKVNCILTKNFKAPVTELSITKKLKLDLIPGVPLKEGNGGPTRFRSHFSKFLSALGRVFPLFVVCSKSHF